MSSRVPHTNRKYKDMSMKQKTRIAEKTYETYLRFFLNHRRMPAEEEAVSIHRKLFETVKSLAPMTTFDEFDSLCRKRVVGYEERIQKELEQGITLEKLDNKKSKKVFEEPTTIKKKKKHKKKKGYQVEIPYLQEQDDTFFFIAGYTSGGAPYGVTWEQMGMNPYDEIE